MRGYSHAIHKLREYRDLPPALPYYAGQNGEFPRLQIQRIINWYDSARIGQVAGFASQRRDQSTFFGLVNGTKEPIPQRIIGSAKILKKKSYSHFSMRRSIIYTEYDNFD